MAPGHRSRLPLAIWFALLFAWLLPREALAWVDLTVARDDLRVTVHTTGQATVEHSVLLLVAGGPLTELTISGVDADAEVLEGAHLLKENAQAGEEPLPVTARRVETKDGLSQLQLSLDGGRGVRRGRYWVHVRYNTDLRKSGALRMAKPHAILEWQGPVWDYGLETTKASFVLPISRNQPTIWEGAGEDAAGTFIPSLTTQNQTFELTLTRPYAARGERVTWPVSFDARTLVGETAADEPAARPVQVQAPRTKGLSSEVRRGIAVGCGVAFMLVFALVWAHGREAAWRAKERDESARPLLPLPTPLRAFVAGVLFAGGGWLTFAEGSGTIGALLIAATSLFIFHRAARSQRSLRKPGAWLFVRKEEAFLQPKDKPTEFFDWRHRAGKLLFLGLVLMFGAATALASRLSLELSTMTMLSIGPLLLLFGTGTSASLRPDLAVDPVELLAKVVGMVESAKQGVRIAPRVRIPQGSADADELRVTFLPETPMKGLRGVEIASETAMAGWGSLLLPVVLVRFEQGSACESSVLRLAKGARPTAGRKPTERVVVLSPKLPTARVTADLVLALLASLSEKVRPSAPAGEPEAAAPSKRRAPVRSGAKPSAAASGEAQPGTARRA
jgi:hypothetical protein